MKRWKNWDMGPRTEKGRRYFGATAEAERRAAYLERMARILRAVTLWHALEARRVAGNPRARYRVSAPDDWVQAQKARLPHG